MVEVIKAYVVTETTEGTGGIVYAKCHAQARREGASQFSDGDWYSVECRRAREYDSDAPDGPDQVTMFETGWWFPCEECNGQARHDNGGAHRDGSFYCEGHADPYAWRELPPWRRYAGHHDDFVWWQTASTRALRPDAPDLEGRA